MGPPERVPPCRPHSALPTKQQVLSSSADHAPVRITGSLALTYPPAHSTRPTSSQQGRPPATLAPLACLLDRRPPPAGRVPHLTTWSRHASARSHSLMHRMSSPHRDIGSASPSARASHRTRLLQSPSAPGRPGQAGNTGTSPCISPDFGLPDGVLAVRTVASIHACPKTTRSNSKPSSGTSPTP